MWKLFCGLVLGSLNYSRDRNDPVPENLIWSSANVHSLTVTLPLKGEIWRKWGMCQVLQLLNGWKERLLTDTWTYSFKGLIHSQLYDRQLISTSWGEKVAILKAEMGANLFCTALDHAILNWERYPWIANQFKCRSVLFWLEEEE